MIAKYKTIRANYPNQAYPFTLNTLKKLAKKYKLALLTSTAKDFVQKDLIDSGIGTDLFEFTQTEHDTTVHKPDPKVFKPTLRYFAKLNISPDQMLYVGDSYNDYLASSQAGLNFIGIPRLKSEKRLMKDGNVRIIKDIGELMQIL